jgi:hypothetical protein
MECGLSVSVRQTQRIANGRIPWRKSCGVAQSRHLVEYDRVPAANAEGRPFKTPVFSSLSGSEAAIVVEIVAKVSTRFNRPVF